MRKPKKWTKSLPVTAGALALAAQLVMGLGPASAAEGDSPDEFPEDVRGMVVLKLPFGGSSIFSSPRMGFDFQVQNRSEYDRLNHRYDPQTGRRLPDVEADRVRTWPLEPPVFELPDEMKGETESPSEGKKFGPPRFGPKHLG